MKNHSFFLLFAVLSAAVTGCRGPAGTAGPMGPTGGSGAPIYLFNQNFDGVGYNPASQFTTYLASGGGAISMGLTDSDFVSAPNSLSVSSAIGAVGAGSALYTLSGSFSYTSNSDYYADAYINLSGISGSNVKVELVLLLGGDLVSDFGYFSTTDSIYTYNNGAMVTLATGFNTGYFHHVVLYWNHATGLSNITVDGTMLCQNISGRNALPTGAPNTGVGEYFPNSTNANNYVLLDNLTIYHY